MNVWLITVGEPLPIDSSNARLMRTGLLARQLLEQGHGVVWWSSAFDHFRKKNREYSESELPLFGTGRLQLLQANPYQKNVSLARLRNHYRLGREFTRLAQQREKPDVVVCSMPTIELSLAAVRYGKKNGIPIVLDIRDLWPDIFLNLAPTVFRPVARALLTPYFLMLEEACRDASAIFGITEEIVEWGVKYSSRPRNHHWDRAFPLAYSHKTPESADVENGFEFWRNLGIVQGHSLKVFSFVGTMGRQLDLSSITEPIRRMVDSDSNLRFVFCGDGERLPELRQRFQDNPAVLLPGRVGFAEIWTLLRMSNAGLIPYKDTEDFRMSIPNKVVEYLSAGAPVISSLSGTTQKLLQENSCGISFFDGRQFTEACSVLAEPQKKAPFSIAATKTYENFFVAEKVYANMISLLEDIASAKEQE